MAAHRAQPDENRIGFQALVVPVLDPVVTARGVGPAEVDHVPNLRRLGRAHPEHSTDRGLGIEQTTKAFEHVAAPFHRGTSDLPAFTDQPINVARVAQPHMPAFTHEEFLIFARTKARRPAI